MLKPKVLKCTSAHSPDPSNTLPSTDVNGMVSNQYDKPGPHAGTFSGGKCCNQDMS